ncbi:SusD/RagB family nutrient-binding outer membrane lipoprotein [Sphingobacterium sp. Mn56C]|uniref:SusD/RagB family nutrient-binding outer membrane lipoprotein n=1 Tax=Sphingobacterium sp. Mn56C TaxID=3395261 RepID=UPI003BD1EF88
MKTKLWILSATICGLALQACEKSFSDLNNDPKNATEVPANALFLAGEKSLADLYSSSNWTTSPFRVIAQVWTQTANINEARYQFATNNAPTGWWTGLYTRVLSNLEEAKGKFKNDKVPDAVKLNKTLIADVLQVYAYSLLVNTYGDIPYSESLNRSIPFPKYDDAKTITDDLLRRLDLAIEKLDITAASFGPADQIFKGDVKKWKQFAATLKLKLALLYADKEPAKANTKALEAIQTGLLTENASFTYVPGLVANSNPVWQDLVNGTYATYYAPAAYFVHTLKAWNDPRLPILFSKDSNADYSGAVAGLGGVNSNLSKFSNFWLSANAPAVLLSYAETHFLVAETIARGIPAAGTVEGHYEAAIRASILEFGGTAADADKYLQQAAVNYASAAGNWKQKIGYQKWIAFANRNWDSWTEIRRLGYPNIDVVSPPQQAESSFPKRFYYPPAEQNSNSIHWNEAVKKLNTGKDEVTATLFWNDK